VTPWKIPLLVAAIAIPVVAGFYVGGPGVGVAVGALVAATIVVLAVRQRPLGPLGEAPSEEDQRRLLLVLVQPLGDSESLRQIVEEATGGGADEETEVMVLAPTRIGFLDRWASDLEGSRRQAQRDLVHAVAALTKAGIAAEARVGDEDLVQAVEDQIGSFPATEVVLVSPEGEGERSTAAAAAELESRLRPRFRWLRVSGPAAR
jgi:hypothetical protein